MTDASEHTLKWHQLPHAPAPGTALVHRDALQDGSVLMHNVTSAGVDESAPNHYPVLLLRSGEAFSAYANRCAHFGVPLAKNQHQLLFKPHTSLTCNVHYARYRWADGVCDQGDCVGESLIAVPVQVDSEGMLRIGPGE